ncbi:hypothetical protein FJ959_08895 [Mesorhizobium sp. B2-2-4]|uniref:hypothetical protein n=1 Tax=unclassified Mesorhizobium TaxID=325217 RepID=UPI0011297C96|nr:MULTISPECIES: hypothetical protein [unclassified Mesorhizobium]TPM58981.1 hypothetical protein FJ959_08895 [Mesorhizobium sp. B2-2-4]TPM67466.1 hypothetical protein FJ965_10035 [Mesorhizobium sp. B2-2-1]
MATQILATGSTAADSADVTVAAGTPITVGLKGVVDANALVIIYLKDDGAAYNQVGRLTSDVPSIMISAPGTYRFSRAAGATCGAFSG